MTVKLSDKELKFLEMNRIKNYTVGEGGVIDVYEHFNIVTQQHAFPVKFGRVGCSFDCSMTSLRTLEGSPSHVRGNFHCSVNQLKSLHDVHKHIKEISGGFYCGNNPIKDSVLGLLLIKGVTYVALDNKDVQKILNKHLGKGRGAIFDAQRELIEAGLGEFAKL